MSKIPANLSGSRKNVAGYSQLMEENNSLFKENERLLTS
jgi:hypothetical protein